MLVQCKVVGTFEDLLDYWVQLVSLDFVVREKLHRFRLAVKGDEAAGEQRDKIQILNLPKSLVPLWFWRLLFFDRSRLLLFARFPVELFFVDLGELFDEVLAAQEGVEHAEAAVS